MAWVPSIPSVGHLWTLTPGVVTPPVAADPLESDTLLESDTVLVSGGVQA